ncbi:hypothetical protein D3C81_1529810 [compost metagenome]
MVVDHVDLDAGVGGVGRVGIAPRHVAQADQSGLGIALIAAHIDDLLEVADGAHVEGVGRRRIAGEQGDEAVSRRDRVLIIVVLIIGVDLHQDRPARPLGIRVLTLHFLEVVDGVGPAFGLQALIAGVVEHLHRTFFIGQLLARLVPCAGGDRQSGDGDRHQDQAGTGLRSGQGRPLKMPWSQRTPGAPLSLRDLYSSDSDHANAAKSVMTG